MSSPPPEGGDYPLPSRNCVTIGEMVKNVMLNLGLMKIRLVSASNGINNLRDPGTK
jgi:hypothetical protein